MVVMGSLRCLVGERSFRGDQRIKKAHSQGDDGLLNQWKGCDINVRAGWLFQTCRVVR